MEFETPARERQWLPMEGDCHRKKMATEEECSWVSVQLEDTATGLRQIRTGVAKTRAFMVLG